MDRAIRRVVLFSVLILAGTQACKKSASPSAPAPNPPPAPTSTFTQAPTGTSTVTVSSTPTPTATISFTPTSSPTPVPSATLTFTRTSTSTFTNTLSPTHTATPSSTSTSTFSGTPTLTWTNTAPPTSTITPSPTSTEIAVCANGAVMGNTYVSGSYAAPSAFVYFQPAVASGPGTLTTVSLNLGGYSGLVQVGIYADASGQPGALLRSSASTALAASGWRTVDLPDLSIAGPATYWIGFECDNTQFVSVGQDVLVSGTHYRMANTYGSMPSNASGLSSWPSDWSVYATYCRPLGALTDTPTPTRTSTPTPTFTNTFTTTETPACASPQVFGNTNSSASYAAPSAYVYFQRAVASGPGTVLGLTASLGGYSGILQVGIYSDAAGQPGTLLSSSSPSSVVASGWRYVDIPDVAISGPATYWLAFECANSPFVTVASAALASGTHYRKFNTFGTFPASAGTVESWSSDWSIYASYCRPPGALTDTPTQTPTFTPTFTVTLTSTPTQTPLCGSPSALGNQATSASYSAISAYVYYSRVITSGAVTAMGLSLNTGGYTGLVQVGIYSDGGNQPASRLAVSSPNQVLASGWRYVDLPDLALSAATTYWLALECDGTQFVSVSTLTPSGYTPYRQPNTFGTLPTVASSLEAWGSEWSVYANVCP